MIAFSIGSVVSENELDYYNRSRKQGKQLENRITEICNIFKTPFTKETLQMATELIANSNRQIEELENSKAKEKIVNE